VLALIAVVPTAFAEAKTSRRTVRAPVVHPAWRSVATDGLTLQSDDGRYQLWTSTTARRRATLINDHTGVRRQLARRSCTPRLLRSSWLLFDCGATRAYGPIAELYSPARGTWTSVELASAIDAQCPASSSNGPHGGLCTTTPIDVGRGWIEFEVLPVGGGVSYEYQNIVTGEVVDSGAGIPEAGYPVTATTSIDLDSLSLTAPVCSPLQNQSISYGGSQIFQSTQFFGPFTIDTVFQTQQAVLYLQRCGSSLHKPLLTLASGDHVPTTNSRIVAWQTTPDRLNAWLLPRLQRVTLTLPWRANGTLGTASLGLILSPRRMYLQTRKQLWVAPILSR
jgi:hypothetical protein